MIFLFFFIFLFFLFFCFFYFFVFFIFLFFLFFCFFYFFPVLGSVPSYFSRFLGRCHLIFPGSWVGAILFSGSWVGAIFIFLFLCVSIVCERRFAIFDVCASVSIVVLF